VLRFLVRAVAALVVLLVAAFAAFWVYVDLPAQVTAFTSMTAKLMCSTVFVAGRDEKDVWEQDFMRPTWPNKAAELARLKVDHETKSVTSTLMGFGHGKAIYREGIGCTALVGLTEDEVRAQGQGVATALPPPDPNVLWPEGDAALSDLPANVDGAKLAAAFDKAFAEPDPEKPRKTREIVVVYQGRIVAERYAPGFTKDTALISQSMAKSVIAALAGIHVGDKKLSLYDPAPVREWADPKDPRHAITLDNLLRMVSGLQFEEAYNTPKSDTNLQYTTGDFAAFTAAKPLEAKPGAKFNYSTGTSNLIGRIVREAAGPKFSDGFAFPRQRLFDPIGARTMTLEVDAAGSLQGGSFVYASARDYARFGLLYLRDGVWSGARILPEGWVKYSFTPTPGARLNKGYGVQFWLNTGTDPKVQRWPNVPGDAWIMAGIQGQNVIGIPSRDVLVVRLGVSEFDNWDISILVEDVLNAIGPTP
jgi:CubicO group peptidase (beta-lactamase class C family)